MFVCPPVCAMSAGGGGSFRVMGTTFIVISGAEGVQSS
jgi:hypothetical protein